MRDYKVPYKRLECIRVLIIYFASTYKWMFLYLKGLNLTIDGWREGRKKYFYKTNCHPRVCLKVWEW